MIGELLDQPPYFKWQFPNLDLRIVNNTNKTVYITDILLEVDESVINQRPILLIPQDIYNLFKFKIVNEGWGNIKNVLIKFNLEPLGKNIPFENNSYKHQINLGEFKKEQNIQMLNVDISQILNNMGVDIETLKEQNEIRRRGTPDCLGKSVSSEEDKKFISKYCPALGIFKSSKNEFVFSALAYGKIYFDSSTTENKWISNTIKFTTEIPLLWGGLLGDSAPPTYQYDAKLEVNRKDYKVVVKSDGSSVSQFIKSGEVDRFNILIGAQKSSIHKFKIKLKFNNNKTITSSPITLSIFIPRSDSEKVQSIDSLIQNTNNQLSKNLESQYLDFDDAFDDAINLQNQLIQNDRINEAISLFKKIQNYNYKSDTLVSAKSNICREPHLFGYASELMSECNKLVADNPSNPVHRFNRGIARSVVNDVSGAISDFQTSLNLLNDRKKFNNKILEGNRFNFRDFKWMMSEKAIIEYLEKNINFWLKSLQNNNNLAIPYKLIWKGNAMAKKGEIKQSINNLFDPRIAKSGIDVPVESWNSLCWYGSLYNYAKDVITACDLAVAISNEDEQPGYKDSRGLAMALTGKNKEAIEDFRSYINWIDKNIKSMPVSDQEKHLEIKKMRMIWIDKLTAGENPITSDEISKLLAE